MELSMTVLYLKIFIMSTRIMSIQTSKRVARSVLLLSIMTVTSVQAQSGIDSLVGDQTFFAGLQGTRDSAYLVFTGLLDSANASHFDLEDPALLQNAQAGEPWVETTVSGERLRGFTSLSAGSLFVPKYHVKYPYYKGNRVVGTIVLKVQPSGVRVASYSPARSAIAVENARKAVANKHALVSSDLFGVRFPSLHRYFLARRTGSSEYSFYSVFGDPDLSMPEIGDQASAIDVLNQLMILAIQDPGGSR
jgi:hypothetical protein